MASLVEEGGGVLYGKSEQTKSRGIFTGRFHLGPINSRQDRGKGGTSESAGWKKSPSRERALLMMLRRYSQARPRGRSERFPRISILMRPAQSGAFEGEGEQRRGKVSEASKSPRQVRPGALLLPKKNFCEERTK